MPMHPASPHVPRATMRANEHNPTDDGVSVGINHAQNASQAFCNTETTQKPAHEQACGPRGGRVRWATSRGGQPEAITTKAERAAEPVTLASQIQGKVAIATEMATRKATWKRSRKGEQRGRNQADQ